MHALLMYYTPVLPNTQVLPRSLFVCMATHVLQRTLIAQEIVESVTG